MGPSGGKESPWGTRPQASSSCGAPSADMAGSLRPKRLASGAMVHARRAHVLLLPHVLFGVGGWVRGEGAAEDCSQLQCTNMARTCPALFLLQAVLGALSHIHLAARALIDYDQVVTEVRLYWSIELANFSVWSEADPVEGRHHGARSKAAQ